MLKGRDADIEKRLLDPFKGPQGELEKKAFFARLKVKKEADRRKKILARNPHAFDAPVLNVDLENESEEEGSGEEERFDLSSFDKNLWADSGTALVRNKQVKALRELLRKRRWIVLVRIITQFSRFGLIRRCE